MLLSFWWEFIYPLKNRRGEAESLFAVLSFEFILTKKDCRLGQSSGCKVVFDYLKSMSFTSSLIVISFFQIGFSKEFPYLSK